MFFACPIAHAQDLDSLYQAFEYSITSFADGGGLFQRGIIPEKENGIFGKSKRNANGTPALPGHNLFEDQDATEAPLGTGIAVLALLSGAYLVGKRQKKDE